MAQSFIIPSEKSIERRRRLAEVMGQQGTSTAPIQSWTQGAARLAQALSGGLDERQANQMEQQRNSALQQALSSGTPDALLNSLDPQLMHIAQIKMQQAQDAANIAHQQRMEQRQTEQDALRHGEWQQSFDQSNQFHQVDDARANAADARAATREANQAPTTRQITKPDGSTVMQQWDPGQRDWFDAPLRNDPNAPPANPNAAIQPPKMAESEAKSFRFYQRARNANKLIGPGEEEALGAGTQDLASAIPFVGNYAVSKARQKGETAATNFLTALGYSDSGAQVNRDEYAKHYKAYIPQRGDGPDIIAQKRQARAEALLALKNTTGKGVAVLDQEDKAYAEADAALAKIKNPTKEERAAIKKQLEANGFDSGGY